MHWCLGKFCSLAPACLPTDENIRKRMSYEPVFVSEVPDEIFENLHWRSRYITDKFGITVNKGDIVGFRISRYVMIWPYKNTISSSPLTLNIPLEVTQQRQGLFLNYLHLAEKELRGVDVTCYVSLEDCALQRQLGKFDKRWECLRFEKPAFARWSGYIVHCSSISHCTEIHMNWLNSNEYDPLCGERAFQSSTTPKKSMLLQIRDGIFDHNIVVKDDESISPVNNTMATNSFGEIVDNALACEMLTCNRKRINDYASHLPAGMRLVALSDDGKIFQKNYKTNTIDQVPDKNRKFQSYWAWRTTLDFVIVVYDIFPSYVMLWILEWLDFVRDNPQHVTMKCINGVRASLTKLLENKGRLSEKSCLSFEQ